MRSGNYQPPFLSSAPWTLNWFAWNSSLPRWYISGVFVDSTYSIYWNHSFYDDKVINEWGPLCIPPQLTWLPCCWQGQHCTARATLSLYSLLLFIFQVDACFVIIFVQVLDLVGKIVACSATMCMYGPVGIGQVLPQNE